MFLLQSKHIKQINEVKGFCMDSIKKFITILHTQKTAEHMHSAVFHVVDNFITLLFFHLT